MHTMLPQTWILVAIVAAVALIALTVYVYRRSRQSYRLRARFGPEYDHAVEAHDSRVRAEAELQRREARVERLTIVPLTPEESALFSAAWAVMQADFVDNPRWAVDQADALVRELLSKRGYPLADFERRAADISVHHPAVVSHYRAAQDIRRRDLNGEVDTEELRRAAVHYRALFDELLEVGGQRPRKTPVRSMRPVRPMEVRS